MTWHSLVLFYVFTYVLGIWLNFCVLFSHLIFRNSDLQILHHSKTLQESFYYLTTLIFWIHPVLVFQIERLWGKKTKNLSNCLNFSLIEFVCVKSGQWSCQCQSQQNKVISCTKKVLLPKHLDSLVALILC